MRFFRLCLAIIYDTMLAKTWSGERNGISRKRINHNQNTSLNSPFLSYGKLSSNVQPSPEVENESSVSGADCAIVILPQIHPGSHSCISSASLLTKIGLLES